MTTTDYIYNFIQWMSIIFNGMLPYMKYIVSLIAILGFLWVNRIFVTNEELRPLLIQSFQDETGRVSGKSISAFVCVSSVIFAWFVAILYSDNHIAPEYFFWGTLGLITSLYGIKEVGKVMGAKFSSPFASSTTNVAENIQVTNTANTGVSYDESILKEWRDSKSDLTYSEWYAKNKVEQKKDDEPIV